MTRMKYAAGLGAIACLLTSTAAFAADATRSASALPVAAVQTQAPTSSVRTATKLEKKSKAIGKSELIGLGVVGAVAVGAIIAVATQDDDDPDSAG